MATCSPSVQVNGSIRVPIIIYHEGLLLIQRGSLSDLPNLKSLGGAACLPPPPLPTIQVSDVS